VQDFLNSPMTAPATRAKALAAVKSFFRFAVRFRFLDRNPAAPLKAPHFRNRLGERYLSEAEVAAMLQQEPDQRNKLLLETLNRTGLGVSELCSLTWSDLEKRPEVRGAPLTVLGKGGKKRSVLVSQELWEEFRRVRKGALILLRASLPARAVPSTARRSCGVCRRQEPCQSFCLSWR